MIFIDSMKKNELKQRMLDIVNTAKAEKRELSKDEEKELEDAKKEIEKEQTEADDDNKVNTSGDTSDNDSTDKETTLEKKEEETSGKTTDDKEEEVVDEKETTVEEDEEVEESGKTTDDKEEVVDELQKEKEDNKRNKNININMEKKEFRLLSAINDIANGRNLDPIAAAVVVEGRNEQMAAGLSANGQIILPTEKRDITVTDSAGATVAVQVENLLAPLRDKMVLSAAGCHYMEGLKNDVKIPVLNAGSAKWASEVGKNEDFGANITGVELKPKRLSTSVNVSLQFLQQSSESAEAVLRQDIMNAVAEKLQQTILSSSKDATAPQGIFADKTPVALTDYKSLCDFEAAVEDANINGKAYIMSNKAKAVLRSMPKSTKNTQLVLEGGEVDGTPAYNTSSVEGKKVAFGDWSYLYIAQFGNIELITDIFSRAQFGEVVLTINAYFDAALVNPKAVAVGEFA